MIVRPRVIPTLLIDDGNLVKTIKFKRPNYLGDPINAIKIFNEKCVDELCILDISASKRGEEPNYKLLEDMASESFMPLSYGGGICNIDQIKRIFRCGFEKVIINTALTKNPGLIREASNYFGSQSIVASIDYKDTLLGKRCFISGGIVKTNLSPEERAMLIEKEGAGEILLYSIDRDGTRKGYDISTIKRVCESVNIPVIACGGANNIDDIATVIEQTKASAVAAGSMFVYFGERNGVLINFPKEEEFYDKGIYKRL